MHVWDVSSGVIILTYHGHTDYVDHIVWSPDGTRIASVGAHEKAVRVWNASTGTTLLTFDRSGGEQTLVWSSDGTRIASTSSRGVRALDVTTGATIKNYSGQFERLLAVTRKVASLPGYPYCYWASPDSYPYRFGKLGFYST